VSRVIVACSWEGILQPEKIMKLIVKAACLSAVAMLAGEGQTAQAATTHHGFLACKARVLYSEELPFAPIGSWLVKATFEITPPHGNPYLAAYQDWMPWQGPPPRRGQSLRVQCDPVDPHNLHFNSRTF
jgi:hypothetical protein